MYLHMPCIHSSRVQVQWLKCLLSLTISVNNSSSLWVIKSWMSRGNGREHSFNNTLPSCCGGFYDFLFCLLDWKSFCWTVLYPQDRSNLLLKEEQNVWAMDKVISGVRKLALKGKCSMYQVQTKPLELNVDATQRPSFLDCSLRHYSKIYIFLFLLLKWT